MKPKMARRFLSRNQWKIVVAKLDDDCNKTGKSLLKHEKLCKEVMIKI